MGSSNPDQLRDLLGRWAKQGITITPGRSGKNLEVASPYDKAFIGDVKALGGRWSAAKKTWAVPESKATELEAALSRAYGGSLDKAVSSSKLPTRVTIREDGDQIIVQAPYSDGFRADAKRLGNWDAQSRAWRFPKTRRADVEQMAGRHYADGATAPEAAAPRTRSAVHASPTARPSPAQAALLTKLARRLERVDQFDSFSGSGAQHAEAIYRELASAKTDRRRASELIDAAMGLLDDEM